MILPQFVIYELVYNYPKFRKDPSITFQEIANYISVALAVALSVEKLRWIKYFAKPFKRSSRRQKTLYFHNALCMSELHGNQYYHGGLREIV